MKYQLSRLSYCSEGCETNVLREFFGVFFNFMRKRELNVQRLPLKKLASLMNILKKRYAGAYAD